VALDVLDPPGDQIGLRFGKAIDLRVRLHTDDAAALPLASQTVRFSIFGDPEGSTLSSDHALTGDDGVASVTLGGGAAEASFRVTASAPRAADAQFDVSVAAGDFVGIEVQLASSSATTLRALLYGDQTCAELSASSTAARALSGPGPSASLTFLNLLLRDYAVAGRAEDANGRLVAAACVDLDAGLLAAGATATLPLPLQPVRVTALGSYELATTLKISAPNATTAFHALADCVNYPADALDDALEAALQPSGYAATFAGLRGVKDAMGCRGAIPVGGGTSPSIDQQVHSLLTVTGAPATQLRAIVADLDAIVGSAQLASRLSVTASGATALAGDHLLGSLRLDATGQKSVTYDLVAAGVPIIEAKDVPIAFDGASLSIGSHGFALRLPRLWRRALDELALVPRFPTLSSPSLRALLGTIVAAAMHGGKTGCAALGDAACAADAACATAVEKACPAALDALAAQLEAGFDPQTGLDLTLRGQAQALDSDGDLAVDRLQMGAWTTPLAVTSSFTGARTP
jgi:hypothetical protein